MNKAYAVLPPASQSSQNNLHWQTFPFKIFIYLHEDKQIINNNCFFGFVFFLLLTDTELFQKHFSELTDKCNNVTEMLK